MKNNSTYSLKKGLIFIFISVLLSICLAFILRIFVFTGYSIPTTSMYPTLLKGDFILSTKFIFQNRNQAIKSGDVIVFNPFINTTPRKTNESIIYVKRCIGLPGDTIMIENGFYKVNGKTAGFFETQNKLSRMPDSSLIHAPEIYYTYPVLGKIKWNIKQFGPLYLPEKGRIIRLSDENIDKYGPLIEYESGQVIFRDRENILLGEKPAIHYQFKNNYYFMAGDNVLDSGDSRYWGPLPESHILSKGVLVINSRDESGKFRFDRVLTKIK